MKVVKVMSIIGIVWFAICLMGLLACLEDDYEAAAGAGLFGLLYAIPFAIVGLVASSKQGGKKNVAQELLDWQALKEKGVLSEEEFKAKKIELLLKM